MHVHEKYRLGPRLGVGGMADVFRAELMGAEGFSRPVAIKRLHAAMSSDPAFCAMFVREARLLSALHHPGIVSVLDFEWDVEGRLFLVLELVDGVNLAQLVRERPLPPAVAGHVMTEVLRGLGHAHARGILHRDVTPHNVLLSWTGEVKLGDFGLAQASAWSRVSDGGLIRGKVPYLSPEQLQGLALDARSDLFSVGVMSYRLLTGRYPFVGRTDQASMAESIARMLTATIVPPQDLQPEIPPALSDVVMRLLERERERRYMSADMVLADMPVSAGGRELLVDLLAERFPGGAPGLASPGSGRGVDTGSQRHDGEAGDPWCRRHTASLPAVQAVQAGGHERAPARSRRWWPGLALVLLVLPLAWVIATQWPHRRIEAPAGEAPPGSTVAGGRVDQAASRAEAIHDGLATGDTLPATTVTRAAATEAATGDTAVDEPASGRAVGRAAGRTSSRAGRALPRRPPQRMQAAASMASAGTSTQVDEPQPPVPEPGQVPAEQAYERGWTEVAPQQTLTGDVPIQRRELP